MNGTQWAIAVIGVIGMIAMSQEQIDPAWMAQVMYILALVVIFTALGIAR